MTTSFEVTPSTVALILTTPKATTSPSSKNRSLWPRSGPPSTRPTSVSDWPLRSPSLPRSSAKATGPRGLLPTRCSPGPDKSAARSKTTPGSSSWSTSSPGPGIYCRKMMRKRPCRKAKSNSIAVKARGCRRAAPRLRRDTSSGNRACHTAFGAGISTASPGGAETFANSAQNLLQSGTNCRNVPFNHG